MTKKTKTIATRNAEELANLFDLSPEEAVEIDLRARLNVKIVDIVDRKKLTHEEVAKLSSASRTRVTAILNGNTTGISTDMLLRILYSLGYRVKLSFSEIKTAA